MRTSHQLFTNSPFEEKQIETTYITKKANPPQVMFADETTRGALNKAVLPNFLAKPPFGRPRFKNVIDLRRLGNTPQARMAKQTIIDEVVSIEWSIVPIEEMDKLDDKTKAMIDEVTNFFNNPNTNNESFEYIMRQMLEDVEDIDSGIWVKEFDTSQRMVELRAVDGATFLKNPDIFGKYTQRADIIPNGVIMDQVAPNKRGPLDSLSATSASSAAINYNLPLNHLGMTSAQASEQGAYFQFGFTSNARPIAFGRKEIVWFEKNPQTNQIYGKSPIESIQSVLQNLKYSIEYALDYFEDNNVPKGFIQLTGADEEEMTAFRDRWNDLQIKTNAEGLLKKSFHRVPITNTENAQFVRIQFSSAELQLIESQSWFSKLVWATYGVNPSELGFTENSNLATETGQGKKFKKKAILPRLKMIEQKINAEILSEWDFHDKIKFKFNTFDIDDEKSKWELYTLQKNGGFKTANEIRKLEGLDELEEGLDLARDEFNKEDADNGKKPKESKEEKNITVDKVLELFEKQLIQKKALLIKELRNSTQNRLTQVKAFSDIINALKGFFSIEGFKSLINQATALLFDKGSDSVEQMVQRKGIRVNAVVPSPEKEQFLSEMVFENIKGVADDAQRKLIQQMKIGVTNGEGINKLIDRIDSVIDVSQVRAKAIARTEANRIESQGQLHASLQIKADGVDIRKWVLMTDDNRTSDLSKAIHVKYGQQDQAIPVDENFKLNYKDKVINQLTTPFHINERCAVVEYIVG